MVLIDILTSIRDEAVRRAVLSFGDDLDIDGESVKGANGYLFFGFHKILQTRVAIKFYYYQHDSHTEVRLLQSVQHQNVLPIREARTVGSNWAYFITPEATVGDLGDCLKQDTPSLPQAVGLLRQILSGVSQLHQLRLVHRDLKPENILIDEGQRPIIADFGSVRRLPDNQDWVNCSRHTTLYRPPESWTSGHYTFASDLYQVGIVGYQLLGGEFPYTLEAWLRPRELTRYKRLTDPFDQSYFLNQTLLAEQTWEPCSNGHL